MGLSTAALFRSLTKSTELVRLELVRILGLEPLLRIHIVAHWVLTVESPEREVAVSLAMEVFADEALDMALVAWNVLLSYFVGGASDPVLSEYAEVAVNELVLVDLSGQVTQIAITLVPHLNLLQHRLVAPSVCQDFSLDLALGGSEAVDFGGDVAGVARHVVLVEVGGSCKFSHDYYYWQLAISN